MTGREIHIRQLIELGLLDSVLVVTRDLGLRDLEVLAAGRLADLHRDAGRPAASPGIAEPSLPSPS